MKRLFATLLALCCLLSGCGCNHDWLDATCEEPRTCYDCGETKGEPLGHDWKKATCEEPKTCAECGETKGEPRPHDWLDATCQQPMTCADCGKTEGEPRNHQWMEATYDVPKTCSECGATEGEALSSLAGSKLYANGVFLVTYEEYMALYQHEALDSYGYTIQLNSIENGYAFCDILDSRGRTLPATMMIEFDPQTNLMAGLCVTADNDVSDSEKATTIQIYYEACYLLNPNLTSDRLADMLTSDDTFELDGGIGVAGSYQGIIYSMGVYEDYAMFLVFLED